MAGFWKRDKGKDKKKGKGQVVLPDIPVSEPRSVGLKGAVEPLTPLVEDEVSAETADEATVRLDNDTKMGLQAEGGPASRHIHADETSAGEETVVFGSGSSGVEPQSAAPTSSDEETQIVGRDGGRVDPVMTRSTDAESTDASVDVDADEGQSVEPETTAPPVRAKTLAPELMEHTSRFADILPDDDEPGAEDDNADADAVPPDHEPDSAAATADVIPAVDAAPTPPPVADEEATRIIGGRGMRRQKEETLPGVRDAGAADAARTASTADPMADPIVGWLVIVDGPGMGHCLPLGYGTNPIGRAPELRVPLMFGDGQISRGTHATIIYDPRGRSFYVQHGGGTNLTYLDDKPLLEPKELSARDRITIGDTVLMLVPLCDDNFDWQDQADA